MMLFNLFEETFSCHISHSVTDTEKKSLFNFNELIKLAYMHFNLNGNIMKHIALICFRLTQKNEKKNVC